MKEQLLATQIEPALQTKRPQQLAQRSLIRDHIGRYTDVEFKNGNTSQSVRNILPIPHVEILMDDKNRDEPENGYSTVAYYDTETKKVEVRPGKEELEANVNLIIIHELSHAYDIQTNREKYTMANLHILDHASLFLVQCENLSDQDIIDALYTDFAFELSSIDEENIDVLIDSALDRIDEKPQNYLPNNVYYSFEKAKQQRDALAERSAWYYALQTVKSLHQKGLLVHPGTYTDILNFTESNLKTYQTNANMLLEKKDVPIYSRSKKSV